MGNDDRAGLAAGMARSAQWVADHGTYTHDDRRRLPDDDFDRCVRTICKVGAPYNLAPNGTGWKISPWHVEVHIPARSGFAVLSTFDNDALTRLVVAAHRHSVRIELSARPGGQSGARLVIRAHPRTAEGDMYDRHPGSDDLAALAMEN